jgi:hypothetical protein
MMAGIPSFIVSNLGPSVLIILADAAYHEIREKPY